MEYLYIIGIIVIANLPHITTMDHLIPLRGAGASFPSAVYKAWMVSYKSHRQQHVQLNISYEAVGSGKGKSYILETGDEAYLIEYAGSDSLLSEEDYQSNSDLQMFPTMAGYFFLLNFIMFTISMIRVYNVIKCIFIAFKFVI